MKSPGNKQINKKQINEKFTHPRLQGFVKRFGKAHLDLACHAAFPLALTPELLYCLRENFQPQAPWIAVADILLSLCDPVGYELYELEPSCRYELIANLKQDFTEERLYKLSDFMVAYISQQLKTNEQTNYSADEDLGAAPHWTALAYIRPEQASHDIAEALQKALAKPNPNDWVKLTSLIESYADANPLVDPLIESGFQPLLVLARAWDAKARGETEVATAEFQKLGSPGEEIEIAGVNFKIPRKSPRKFGTVCASPEGKKLLEKAKAEWKDSQGNHLTFERIAEMAELSDKTVRRFFNGRKIYNSGANSIIQALDLEWDSVISLEEEKIRETINSFEVVTVNRRGEIINRELKKARYFTEHLPNNITLEMVAIPGGTFIMGSPEDEAERYDDESPQHQVTVQPFFMGKYPITQAQWRVVANMKHLRVNCDLEPEPSNFKGDNKGDNLPVEKVSWYDAVEFCDRLSQHTGKEYRLPSEAEWEYACRAGTTTPFHFGETITAELANYNASSTYASEPQGEYREQTTPVGQFLPNAFGLYDMHGNVWEWCLDDWHSDYENAPTDGSAWFDSENDNLSQKSGNALLRSGSWDNYPEDCRSACRSNPVRAERVFYTYNIGFRVVCGVGSTLHPKGSSVCWDGNRPQQQNSL
ncbi:MAG: formylglycine-generating enzyme family protein [Cyanobacteria bacterium P01_A01_bin.45]